MALGSAKVFCIIMIIIGILGVLAGSAAPFWLTPRHFDHDYGLWYLCTYGKCGFYGWGDPPYTYFSIWFLVLHGAAGLASLMDFILLFFSLYKICGDSDSATGTGVLALLSGILGMGAGAVFYFFPWSSMAFTAFSGYRTWGFFVFSAGSAVTTLFSIILLVLPNPTNNAVRPL